MTVQQIAERADLGVGTLFYYASSKTELFLMAYNSVLEQAIEDGIRDEAALPADAELSERVSALALPIARLHQSPQAPNLMRYQRDLLFGDSNDTYRREGIEFVRRFETRVAQVLGHAHEVDPESMLARLSARAVFAALHFELALPDTDLTPETRFASAGETSLRMQIEVIIEGFRAIEHQIQLSSSPSTAPTGESESTPRSRPAPSTRHRRWHEVVPGQTREVVSE